MGQSIASRIGIDQSHTLHAQAVADEVADSALKLEWKATDHRASATITATELVEAGL